MIWVRRLLCSEDTSKVSCETTFSSFRLLAAAKFVSAAAIFGYGITFAIASYPSFITFLNTPIIKDVRDSGGPTIMKMIEGDLTTKLCEKSAPINRLGLGLFLKHPSKIWKMEVVSTRSLSMQKEQERRLRWRACFVKRKGWWPC